MTQVFMVCTYLFFKVITQNANRSLRENVVRFVK